MRIAICLPLALCALSAPLAAQDAPSPSPKLAAFRPLVGTWTGKGTAVPQEGAPATEWTGTIQVRPILDGFFFQEDTVVDVGMGTPLQMRSIYGWDGERERYVVFGCGNTGESNLCALRIPAPGTMVVGVSAEQNGEAFVSRGTWKIDGDRMHYTAQRANGAGAFYTEVDGVFERTEVAPKGVAEASFMSAPIPSQLASLSARMVGTYDVKGTMTMMPGMPEMKIWGTETTTTIFGGHTIYSVVKGHADNDQNLYVGETYMTWDANDRCFDVVMVDNMGAIVKFEASMVGDDSLVSVHAGPMMGTPAVQRTITKLGEHGVEAVSSYLIMGSAEPLKSFEAKYTRKTD